MSYEIRGQGQGKEKVGRKKKITQWFKLVTCFGKAWKYSENIKKWKNKDLCGEG